MRQLGLTKGILERWTKGFSCSGVVGEDVVQGLKDAIARRGVSNNNSKIIFLYYCMYNLARLSKKYLLCMKFLLEY